MKQVFLIAVFILSSCMMNSFAQTDLPSPCSDYVESIKTYILGYSTNNIDTMAPLYNEGFTGYIGLNSQKFIVGTKRAFLNEEKEFFNDYPHHYGKYTIERCFGNIIIGKYNETLDTTAKKIRYFKGFEIWYFNDSLITKQWNIEPTAQFKLLDLLIERDSTLKTGYPDSARTVAMMDEFLIKLNARDLGEYLALYVDDFKFYHLQSSNVLADSKKLLGEYLRKDIIDHPDLYVHLVDRQIMENIAIEVYRSKWNNEESTSLFMQIYELSDTGIMKVWLVSYEGR